jgi:galactokinase
MKTGIEQLKSAFAASFGVKPAGVVRAPGRVNLIGEHTDYNDGFVLPIAIERQTLAAWSPRPDTKVLLRSVQAPGQDAELDLAGEIRPGKPKWANYCRGVAAGLRAYGLTLAGCNVMFDSDVPIGGGLSSSASLEVATAMAMMAAAAGATGATGAAEPAGAGAAVTGAAEPAPAGPAVAGAGAVAGAAQSGSKIAPRELALICQKAEHDFAGAPCGIMDQSIAILGRPGRALLLDCRSGETRQIPFDDPNLVLLVADTKVKHAISDGGYAARRDQCHAAAAKLHAPALRDVDQARLDQAGRDGVLSGKELMRARHVVGEISRTLRAVEALAAGDYAAFGRLMYGSHESLRDDYEVSCEELDAVVELARPLVGVYGARMTGGGFGGCAIVLAEAGRAKAIADAVAAGFDARFGRRCPIFATRAAQGASVVE